MKNNDERFSIVSFILLNLSTQNHFQNTITPNAVFFWEREEINHRSDHVSIPAQICACSKPRRSALFY